MASQKNIFTTMFAAVFALLCIMVAVQSSPVPSTSTDTEDVATSDSLREPRFYGMGGSQATAVASATAVGTGGGGYGGYPYGGGLGYGGGMGYPYGK